MIDRNYESFIDFMLLLNTDARVLTPSIYSIPSRFFIPKNT